MIHWIMIQWFQPNLGNVCVICVLWTFHRTAKIKAGSHMVCNLESNRNQVSYRLHTVLLIINIGYWRVVFTWNNNKTSVLYSTESSHAKFSDYPFEYWHLISHMYKLWFRSKFKNACIVSAFKLLEYCRALIS
jgi:hypothetical protein